MSWTDRLRPAAYTSPSGVRILFDFENVRRNIARKTTGFEFTDLDGTYVQQSGRSGRRLPLRIFFWGDDHDLEAQAFDDALLETGIGRLEHPMYGAFDVVPFGNIAQRDDLKTAANQTIFEVTFWETIGALFTNTQGDPAQAVIAAVEEFNVASAAEFTGAVSLDTATEQVTFKNDYQVTLDVTQSRLQAIADTSADVQAQFNAVVDSINQSIDVLVGDPLTLAFQTAIAIQSPARAVTAIQARLDAYAGLLGLIVNQGEVADSNRFHSLDLYGTAYVTGQVLSTVNNQFITKTGALEAASFLLDQMDTLVAWRDAGFAALGEIDTGAAYQQLQEAVALTAGFLVGISFSLKQERSIVLDRARTIVDLAAELYGEVDAQLDFLINTNNLTGSEILELPAGREIVYYV